MKAVLFDLDETLYDHRHACMSGIQVLQRHYPALLQKSAEELETLFWRMLDVMHHEVLRGNVTQEDSRRLRIIALFEACGAVVAEKELEKAISLYSEAYKAGRRAIPGAVEVLTWLREQGYVVAVVTNGLTQVQQDKMEVCGITHLIDHLVTAQDVGTVKPERAMFEVALQLCGAEAEEALMIGDSWGSDIIGAQAAGLPAIWLNRRGEVCQDVALATEIVDLHQLFELWPELSLEQSRLQSKGAKKS